MDMLVLEEALAKAVDRDLRAIERQFETMAKLWRRPSSCMKVYSRDRSEFGLYCLSR